MEQFKYFKITVQNYPESICILGFDLSGKLRKGEFNLHHSEELKKRLFTVLPVTLDELNKFSAYKGVQVQDISKLNLSFEAFWKSYGYKVGNKTRVKKKWDQLPPEDQALALGFIRKYKEWAAKKKIDQCYPETYLNQRRWENEIE